MTSAAFPTVIDALLATAAVAVSDARVVRGRDISNDPGNVVMIGVNDPTASGLGWESTGEYEQAMQTFGGKRQEIGRVNGLVIARNGDSDAAAALDTAFTMIAALEASIATTPNLGVTSLEYLVAEMESGAVQESSNNEGASAALSFVVTYKARI